MRYLSLLLLFLLISGGISYAQSTIRGEVKDFDGNPIPYLQIHLKQDGRTINGAYTNEYGEYQIFGVSAGIYDIEVVPGGTTTYDNAYIEKDVSIKNSELSLLILRLIALEWILDLQWFLNLILK